MIQNEWLIHLFDRRVDELALENNLNDDDKQRIRDVFRFALENPYADEREISARLKQQVFKMKIRRAELENIGCYVSRSFDFGDLTVVRGENRTGKSALIYALFFGLFGTHLHSGLKTLDLALQGSRPSGTAILDFEAGDRFLPAGSVPPGRGPRCMQGARMPKTGIPRFRIICRRIRSAFRPRWLH